MPHTPGPWKAKLGRTMAFDMSIVNGEGFIVARTSESNGHLISAAPDLVAALRAVVGEVLRGEPLPAMHDGWTRALSQARAALAKAEGRA